VLFQLGYLICLDRSVHINVHQLRLWHLTDCFVLVVLVSFLIDRSECWWLDMDHITWASQQRFLLACLILYHTHATHHHHVVVLIGLYVAASITTLHMHTHTRTYTRRRQHMHIRTLKWKLLYTGTVEWEIIDCSCSCEQFSTGWSAVHVQHVL
jgi:hypothetical protein